MCYNSLSHIPPPLSLEIVDKPMKRISLDADDLIRKYLAGQPENALALEFGVSRNVIRRHLLENDITPRGLSESQFLRAAQRTAAERKANAAAAHIAATGREKSFAERCLTAQTRQANGVHISHHERTLAAMLTARGLDFIQQQAIGPYNCDLAAHPVAVEVFGGHWHWNGDHLRSTPKRFDYILNAGWHILVIPVTVSSPLTPAVADYVTSVIEETRRNPPPRCEYRVVWRAGEFVTAGSLDDDDISIEPPFASGRDPATGQYTTISR